MHKPNALVTPPPNPSSGGRIYALLFYSCFCHRYEEGSIIYEVYKPKKHGRDVRSFTPKALQISLIFLFVVGVFFHLCLLGLPLPPLAFTSVFPFLRLLLFHIFCSYTTSLSSFPFHPLLPFCFLFHLILLPISSFHTVSIFSSSIFPHFPVLPVLCADCCTIIVH
jgi:hypothetical protein